MVTSGQCLEYNHEDLSLDPQHMCKSQRKWHTAGAAAVGMWKEDPWRSLTSLCRPGGEF